MVYDAQGLAKHFPVYKLFLFLVGAALMRAAGCAFNDLIDRDIDARVERTRGRPIPAGQITPKQAVMFIVLCSLVSFGILVQLGTLAILLGVMSLLLVAAYPFMKRITWWPQAWLGLTFNWGFLIGFATVGNALSIPALVFYAGLIAWTIGYDTIYAHQDKEDDALIGVRSTALYFGRDTRVWLSLFYSLALVAFTIAFGSAGAAWPAWLGLVAAFVLLGWQILVLDIHDGPQCLALFKFNHLVGAVLFLGLVLAIPFA